MAIFGNPVVATFVLVLGVVLAKLGPPSVCPQDVNITAPVVLPDGTLWVLCGGEKHQVPSIEVLFAHGYGDAVVRLEDDSALDDIPEGDVVEDDRSDTLTRMLLEGPMALDGEEELNLPLLLYGGSYGTLSAWVWIGHEPEEQRVVVEDAERWLEAGMHGVDVGVGEEEDVEDGRGGGSRPIRIFEGRGPPGVTPTVLYGIAGSPRRLFLSASSTGTSFRGAYFRSEIAPLRWTHVAVVVRPDRMLGYVDGRLEVRLAVRPGAAVGMEQTEFWRTRDGESERVHRLVWAEWERTAMDEMSRVAAQEERRARMSSRSVSSGKSTTGAVLGPATAEELGAAAARTAAMNRGGRSRLVPLRTSAQRKLRFGAGRGTRSLPIMVAGVVEVNGREGALDPKQIRSLLRSTRPPPPPHWMVALASAIPLFHGAGDLEEGEPRDVLPRFTAHLDVAPAMVHFAAACVGSGADIRVDEALDRSTGVVAIDPERAVRTPNLRRGRGHLAQRALADDWALAPVSRVCVPPAVVWLEAARAWGGNDGAAGAKRAVAAVAQAINHPEARASIALWWQLFAKLTTNRRLVSPALVWRHHMRHSNALQLSLNSTAPSVPVDEYLASVVEFWALWWGLEPSGSTVLESSGSMLFGSTPSKSTPSSDPCIFSGSFSSKTTSKTTSSSRVDIGTEFVLPLPPVVGDTWASPRLLASSYGAPTVPICQRAGGVGCSSKPALSWSLPIAYPWSTSSTPSTAASHVFPSAALGVWKAFAGAPTDGAPASALGWSMARGWAKDAMPRPPAPVGSWYVGAGIPVAAPKAWRSSDLHKFTRREGRDGVLVDLALESSRTGTFLNEDHGEETPQRLKDSTSTATVYSDGRIRMDESVPSSSLQSRDALRRCGMEWDSRGSMLFPWEHDPWSDEDDAVVELTRTKPVLVNAMASDRDGFEGGEERRWAWASGDAAPVWGLSVPRAVLGPYGAVEAVAPRVSLSGADCTAAGTSLLYGARRSLAAHESAKARHQWDTGTRLSEASSSTLLGHRGEDDHLVTFRQMEAEDGDPGAATWLGQRYYWGQGGVPRDPQRAAELFDRGAQGGNPAAQFNLGVMHMRGDGDFAPDRDRAMEYFAKAADQGYSPAYTGLADAYLSPDDEDDRNVTRAIEYLEKACDAGGDDGCRSLGRILSRGMYGVEADAVEAVRRFALAAALGNRPAYIDLAGAFLLVGSWADDADQLLYRAARDKGPRPRLVVGDASVDEELRDMLGSVPEEVFTTVWPDEGNLATPAAIDRVLSTRSNSIYAEAVRRGAAKLARVSSRAGSFGWRTEGAVVSVNGATDYWPLARSCPIGLRLLRPLVPVSLAGVLSRAALDHHLDHRDSVARALYETAALLGDGVAAENSVYLASRAIRPDPTHVLSNTTYADIETMGWRLWTNQELHDEKNEEGEEHGNFLVGEEGEEGEDEEEEGDDNTKKQYLDFWENWRRDLELVVRRWTPEWLWKKVTTWVDGLWEMTDSVVLEVEALWKGSKVHVPSGVEIRFLSWCASDAASIPMTAALAGGMRGNVRSPRCAESLASAMGRWPGETASAVQSWAQWFAPAETRPSEVATISGVLRAATALWWQTAAVHGSPRALVALGQVSDRAVDGTSEALAVAEVLMTQSSRPDLVDAGRRLRSAILGYSGRQHVPDWESMLQWWTLAANATNNEFLGLSLVQGHPASIGPLAWTAGDAAFATTLVRSLASDLHAGLPPSLTNAVPPPTLNVSALTTAQTRPFPIPTAATAAAELLVLLAEAWTRLIAVIGPSAVASPSSALLLAREASIAANTALEHHLAIQAAYPAASPPTSSRPSPKSTASRLERLRRAIRPTSTSFSSSFVSNQRRSVLDDSVVDIGSIAPFSTDFVRTRQALRRCSAWVLDSHPDVDQLATPELCRNGTAITTAAFLDWAQARAEYLGDPAQFAISNTNSPDRYAPWLLPLPNLTADGRIADPTMSNFFPRSDRAAVHTPLQPQTQTTLPWRRTKSTRPQYPILTDLEEWILLAIVSSLLACLIAIRRNRR